MLADSDLIRCNILTRGYLKVFFISELLSDKLLLENCVIQIKYFKGTKKMIYEVIFHIVIIVMRGLYRTY